MRYPKNVYLKMCLAKTRRFNFNVKLVGVSIIIIITSTFCYFHYLIKSSLSINCINDNEIAVDLVSSETETETDCNNMYNKYDIPTWNELVSKRNDIGYDELSCNSMDDSNKIIPFRIFQIGFHRIGTRSLFEFFSGNSYGSAHYQCKYNCSLNDKFKQICDLQPCFRIMIDNLLNSRLLLNGLCHEYVYFGDFGISPLINNINKPENIYLQWDIQFDILHIKYKYFWFELLDQQYKCSKFILNIRPLNHWLLSRSEHKAKYVKYSSKINQYWQLHSFWYFREYNDRNKTNWNSDLTKEEVFEYWIKDWYFYNCKVINYFKSQNRMNDLLIFDVENDDIQKLINFFDGNNGIKLNLNSKHWQHTNWKHEHKTNISTKSEIDKLLKVCKGPVDRR